MQESIDNTYNAGMKLFDCLNIMRANSIHASIAWDSNVRMHTIPS